MVYKCKICGGETTIHSQDGIAICDYCGTKQALPLFTEESARLLYDRGNNYLMHNEYDKAEAVFNQLLTISPNASELYWDLVLCKYGVTYVCDPKTGKYIPTCNRTHYLSVFKDENYLKATSLASGEKLQLYKDDAATIDNIQKGILAVSRKEKPFDIFISYKETDASGNRTKDSVAAQRLYEKLTGVGYKVFFSRITLEDKIGTEYEPYIYAALHSSKVMLTLASSKENMEAAWVKNEWSRFLLLRQADASKTLLPLYFDMDKADLPDEFSLLTAYDTQTTDFEAELLRGIKKLIPVPITLAQRRKKFMKTAGIVAAGLVVFVGVATAIILPKELAKSRVQAEQQVQQVQRENAEKAQTEENIKEEQYQAALTLFDNADYTAAAEAFTALGDYKEAAQMVEKCQIQPEFDAAMQLYYDCEFAQAAWAFEALGDFEGAADMYDTCVSAWRNMLATKMTGNYYEEKYYITENGTVKPVDGSYGSAHSQIDITKNGTVKSIISNDEYDGYDDNLFVLHENGQFTNPQLDSTLRDMPEWENVVKVSGSLQNMGVVGLTADGKMVFILTWPGDNHLEALSEWSDIVDFKHNFGSGNGVNCGLMIGLRADGTLCEAFLSNNRLDREEEGYSAERIQEVLDKFQNVKSFIIETGKRYPFKADFTLMAVTKDGRLLTYSYASNEFTESDGKDICEIISSKLALKTNGDMIELDTGKVLMRDVVHAKKAWDGCYAITRNGNIHLIKLASEYYGTPTTVEETGCKTTVYEEWLMRLS